MKPLHIALLLTCFVRPSLLAYVTDINSNGTAKRWFLDPTSFLVPLNSVNPNIPAIRYHLHEGAFSAANREAELNSIRAAFDQWESVPGTILKFEDAGLVSGPIDINTEDTTNVVYWEKNSLLVNGETTSIGFRLGITFTSGFANSPVIAESDIVLNGVQFEWFTDFEAKDDPRQFVEGVVLHEIGHLIGLSHSTIGAASLIFDAGGSGINAITGLSPDEIAFLHHTYGTQEMKGQLGTVQGQITKEGNPVYGASVVLEDLTGAIVTGSISRLESLEAPDGHYVINGVPPGDYHLRVLPLQPNTAENWLIVPGAIPLREGHRVDTRFRPSINTQLSVVAGQTTELDVAVEPGDVPFIISGIRSPTTNGFSFSLVRSGVALRPGDQGYVVGVYGPDLPREGAVLSITGPGISISTTQTEPDLFPGLVHILAVVNVADDAAPGIRSIILRKGLDQAHASGYLEILPPITDYNFDGLDDTYQRRYFDPFTVAEAGPNQDPDGDGFTNAEESELDSDPTDPGSIPTLEIEPFEIISVSLRADGSQVTFASVAKASYQLYSRHQVATGTWQPVGNPVTATGSTTTIHDPTATDEFEFYRVESVPLSPR